MKSQNLKNNTSYVLSIIVSIPKPQNNHHKEDTV